MEFPKTAEEMKALRKSLGLTQVEMAEKMGIAKRTYEDIEGGRTAFRSIHGVAAGALAHEMMRENACQAMSETHRSWESRCHSIMAALGFDFGGGPPPVKDEERLAGWAKAAADAEIGSPRHYRAMTHLRECLEEAGTQSEDLDRFTRAGEHLHAQAKAMGWKDDGEGAYEFLSRITYETGHSDALREAKGER